MSRAPKELSDAEKLAQLRKIVDECLAEISCATTCTLHGDRGELVYLVHDLLKKAYPVPVKPPQPDEGESFIHLHWADGDKDFIHCETSLVRRSTHLPIRIEVESKGTLASYVLAHVDVNRKKPPTKEPR